MAETTTDYGELKADMFLPSLEVFQQMSIDRVGQNGLFQISDKRRHLQKYEDEEDEDVEYHLILCSHCEDDDYPCNAATSARDVGDGTGKVVVVGTDFIHSDLCISRQVRLQQQQVQGPETTRPPEGAEDAGRVENGDTDLVMTVEDQPPSPSRMEKPDELQHEISQLQNPASLASAILSELPSSSSEGVLSWLQNQSLEQDITTASPTNGMQQKQQEESPEEHGETRSQSSKKDLEFTSEEAVRTAMDVNNAASAASLSPRPVLEEAAHKVVHATTASLASRSAPEEAPSMTVDINNTNISAYHPPQRLLNVQVPDEGAPSTSIIPQGGQSLQTEEAGSSSVAPTQSGVLPKVNDPYKTLNDADRAVQAWHANAYPDRCESHSLTKMRAGSLRSTSLCKLRRYQRVKDCPARIHLSRSSEESLFQVTEVNLQHSAACNAYTSTAGTETNSPRTHDDAQSEEAPGSTSDASILVEGLATMDPATNPSKFTGNSAHAQQLQQHPGVVENTVNTAQVDVGVQQASVVDSEMLDSVRKESVTGNKLSLTEEASPICTQLSSTLPSSRQPSASSTSTLPEGRSRQMARRGGRPANSSRPQPQKKKPSVDYTEYAGNTSVRAAINASKAAMKKTESPVLPSESSSSDSEASSTSSETESTSSAEGSDSESEGMQHPADETFKRGAKFADYEAIESALQLWHLRHYNDSEKTRFCLRRKRIADKPTVTCRLREKRSIKCSFHVLFHPKKNGYTVAKSNAVHSAACDRQAQQESTGSTPTTRNHMRENSLVSQASGDGRVVAKLPNRERSVSGKFTLQKSAQTSALRTGDQSHREKKAASRSRAREKASSVDNVVESSCENDPIIDKDSSSESSSDEDGATAGRDATRHSTRKARASSSGSASESESDVQASHARASKSKLTTLSSSGTSSSNQDLGSTNVGDKSRMQKDENTGRSKVTPTGSVLSQVKMSSNAATIEEDVNDMLVDKVDLTQACKEESQARARFDETAHGTGPVEAEPEPELSSEEEEILLARKISFRDSGWPEEMVERFEAHHLHTPQALLDAGVTEGIEEIWEFVRDEEPFDTNLKGQPTKAELYLVKKHMSTEWKRIEACIAARN